jgi:hypothetical protein
MTSEERGDVLLRAVTVALASGVTPRLAASVRNYARRSRARRDIVQDVVKNLMELVRDAPPNDMTLAKRSCQVADWAIEAYYEPESARAAEWTERIRPLPDEDSKMWRR